MFTKEEEMFVEGENNAGDEASKSEVRDGRKPSLLSLRRCWSGKVASNNKSMSTRSWNQNFFSDDISWAMTALCYPLSIFNCVSICGFKNSLELVFFCNFNLLCETLVLTVGILQELPSSLILQKLC